MPEKCPVCGQPMDARRLHEHLVDEHGLGPEDAKALARGDVGGGSSAHRCVFCGTSFDSPEKLKSHHLSAHGK